MPKSTQINTRSKSNSPIRSPGISPVKTPIRSINRKNSNNNDNNTKDDTADIISLLTSNAYILLLLSVFLVRIIVIFNEHYEIINITPHENKKYPTFEAFLPFYKEQHTNQYSNMLHFIGTSIFLIVALSDLKITVSYIIAMIMGLNIHPITIHSSHGLIEALAMMSTYLISVKILSGKVSKAAGAVMVAYACAWIGHFFLEMNRPATFIYPTYSLLGDLSLWRDVIINVIKGGMNPPPSSYSSMRRFLLNFTFRF